MQGCPRKAEIQAPRAAVAEVQDVLRPLSTGDRGKEAQPPWDGHISAGLTPNADQGSGRARG